MSKYFDQLKPLVKIPLLNDFDKVFANIEDYEKECDELNQAIQSKEPYKAMLSLIQSSDKIKELVVLLLAVRIKDMYSKTGFKTIDELSMDDWMQLISESGVVEFLKDCKIRDIYSYLAGIEVGLDTSSRKNRFGDYFENIVYEILNYDTNVTNIRKQVEMEHLAEELGIDYTGKNKKLDFVFECNNKVYLLETNLYNTKGSKISATSGEYREFDENIRKYHKLEFMWITSGEGWKSHSKVFDLNSKSLSYFITLDQLADYDYKISNIIREN